MSGPAVLSGGEKDEHRAKLQERFFEAGLHRRGSKKGTNSIRRGCMALYLDDNQWNYIIESLQETWFTETHVL